MNFKLCRESLAQRHGVVSKKTWILKNTTVWTTILTLSLQCCKTYRDAMMSIMLQQCYNKVQWNELFDKCTTWNCLSTTLYWINTTITLVFLTNYMDLISAGVSHNCGYRTSSGIVNVGVNIRVTKLSYNTHYTQYWQTENHFISIFAPSGSMTRVGVTVTVGVGYSSDRRAPQRSFSMWNVLQDKHGWWWRVVISLGGQY